MRKEQRQLSYGIYQYIGFSAIRTTDEEVGKKKLKARTRRLLRTLQDTMWSKGHLVQTALHLLQVSLSYLLMLIFMTYNTWLCAATVVGLTFGYFLFGWRRKAALLHRLQGGAGDDGDCCQ